MQRFASIFAEVEDPRAANARHEFITVLMIALLAVLCGAEGCSDMADFGQAKAKLLRTVIKLPHGVPSHDTFSRVFRHLNPDTFASAFARFSKAFAAHLEGVIAIDGKAVRGAYERGRKTTPLHLVNVWAAEARLCIGQQLAPGRSEVQGVLNALALLSLEHCLVTADALHCRADTAQAILATGADYALALKDNQPSLRQAAERLIAEADEPDRAETQAELGHDRIERRRAVVVPAKQLAFPGIAAVAGVETVRTMAKGPASSITRFFVLSSLVSASQMIAIARRHWGIENQLHWVLDVALAEDAARTRKDHGPQNLAILRKIALNLLTTHPDKASIRRKIKKAGWDDAFLLSLIAQMR
jgi:predicted transposase YbfD/YdcC